MGKFTFRKWLAEWADFGTSPVEKKPAGQNDELLHPVNASVIIDELKHHPIGTFTAEQRWEDVLEWGSGPGALQIDASPLGSYKLIVRRGSTDLQGETVWICKKVLPLDEGEHQRKEISLAHEMHEDLQKISESMLDGPAREYTELERLAWRMWAAAKKDHPRYCMFPVSLRKMEENVYYKLVFEFRGHGLETPGHGRAEQFDIDLFWNKDRGLIRCWGYDIDSTVAQHTWQVQPSEWDEWYSPNQPPEEIIDTVIKMFSTY